MQSADRKLAWSAVLVLAVIALELAWFLFVGPANYGASNAAHQVTDSGPWEWLFSATFWTAAFTGFLTWSTIGLWRQTKRLAEGADEQSKKMESAVEAATRQAVATENAIHETRRIGEAQVRAYVSVIRAEITFLSDFRPDDVVPKLTITAHNNGESPARLFSWRPEVEYISGTHRMRRGLGGLWVGNPGASIAAGDPFEESVLLPEMGLARFADIAGANPRLVLIRIKIEYTYVDVFDVAWKDQTFFVGDAYEGANRMMWGTGSFDQMTALLDWDDQGHFNNH